MDRVLWSRILLILGLFGMLLGALDPLEGSVIILPCAAIATLGVWIGRARLRRLESAALILIAVGVGAMFLLSAVGGVGGASGTSAWWALIVAPYPIGWILGIVVTVLSLVETFRGRQAAA